MNILVTGATGFIGYHLCNKLHDDHHNVYAIGVHNENMPNHIKFYNCELDKVPWENIPNIDVCFHQAANNNTLDQNEDHMFEANLEKPSLLFEKLLYKNCKKFIYASSCSVYGNQPAPYFEDKTKIECLNPYARSKYLFELFAKTFANINEVTCVGLRYSNVYGPKENHKCKRASMIHQIIDKAKNKQTVNLFKYGEQKRDWVYVKDVVEANLLAVNINQSNIFNVGSGVGVSFNDIVRTASNIMGDEVVVNYVDCDFLDRYQNYTCVDLEKSKNILKYNPKYDINLGIKELLNEFSKISY